MTTPTFDPGLTQQFGGTLNRAINKDGSFNVVRRGASWKDVHPYLHLINASWPVFSGVIVLSYLVVNAAFALIYYSLGPGQLAGAEAATEWQRFLNAFYFSADTLTTVGYGNITPKGAAANAVSVIEALCGWLGFAVATGLLFGRVSRWPPTSKAPASSSASSTGGPTT
jgi:inward rectifier potassium channel